MGEMNLAVCTACFCGDNIINEDNESFLSFDFLSARMK